MKTTSMCLSLLFGLLTLTQAASAEKFYRCEVTTQSKRDSLETTPTAFYISDLRYSTISLPWAKTTLEVYVGDNEVLNGTVNGQRNFILTGTRAQGSFESASAKGEIRCNDGQEEKSMLVHVPGRLIKQTDRSMNYKLVSLSTVSQYCYFGDANTMIAQIQSTVAGVKFAQVNKRTLAIKLTQSETRCLEGSGYREDFECTKYDQSRDYTYELANCSAENGGDNR